jgi:hypothetical protein
VAKSKQIEAAVKRLLNIVEELAAEYPQKRFTLDGRLVGDIGEVLAGINYDIRLFDVQKSRHDGNSSDGKLAHILRRIAEEIRHG